MGERAGEGEREKGRTHAGEKEREKSALAPLFIRFSLHLGSPVQTGLSQGCCLFYLKPSLWSLDLLSFYFRGLFPSCLLATAILDSFSLFYLPNIPPARDGRPHSLGIGALRSFWLLSVELGW